MKKSRFKDEQSVAALRRAEAPPRVAAARMHGASEQLIHCFPKTFDGMQVSDLQELRGLRDENTRLTTLLVERDPGVKIIREIQAKKFRASEYGGAAHVMRSFAA